MLRGSYYCIVFVCGVFQFCAKLSRVQDEVLKFYHCICTKGSAHLALDAQLAIAGRFRPCWPNLAVAGPTNHLLLPLVLASPTWPLLAPRVAVSGPTKHLLLPFVLASPTWLLLATLGPC